MPTPKNPRAIDATAAEPSTIELESEPVPATVMVEPSPVLSPGGTYVNTGLVDLVLLQPATVLAPGQVVELEYDPGHRDLRLASADEIEAARETEAAEQAATAAPQPTTTGQE